MNRLPAPLLRKGTPPLLPRSPLSQMRPLWNAGCGAALIALATFVGCKEAGTADSRKEPEKAQPEKPQADNAQADKGKIHSEPVYGPWRAAIIGGGGYHMTVVFSPTNPNRYYTYLDTAGLFRSDDAGESWRLITAKTKPRLTSYEVRGVAVDPHNEDVLLAAFSSKNGLFRSTDGGGSWDSVLPDVRFYGNGPYRWSGPIIAFQPGNSEVAFAATQGDGFFKSTDGGKTWANKGLQMHFSCNLVFDAKNPNRMWLTTANAKPKWGPAGEYKGGFFLSEDAGETWTLLTEDFPAKFVQDPKNPDVFYGIHPETSQITRSTDAGKTWQPFTEGLETAEGLGITEDWTSRKRYRSISAGPDFLLCGSSRGTIYRMPAGGTKWEPVPLESVDYGSWRPAWKSSEHPGEWPTDHFGRKNHFASAMSNIAIDPRDPNHWLITDWYAVYQSYDAGKNWKITIDGVESTAVLDLKQDATDPNRVYLNMSDNGLFLSDDGGENFLKPAFPSSNAKSTDVSPALPERVWVAGNREGGVWAVNQIFVSENRGKDWKRASLKGLPHLADAQNGGGGAAPTEDFRLDRIVVHPVRPNELYVTVSGECAPGQGGVYRSVDGGQSWGWFGEGLEGKLFSTNFWTRGNQIVLHPDGSMLLFGQNRQKAYRFDTGLQKWVLLDFDCGGEGIATRLAVDPNLPGRFYLAIRNQGVFRTDDAGKNWTKIHDEVPGLASLQADLVKPGRIAVGLKDTVLFSGDSGATWTDLDPGRDLPCLPAQGMAFAGDHLVMATQSCGAYWRKLDQ